MRHSRPILTLFPWFALAAAVVSAGCSQRTEDPNVATGKLENEDGGATRTPSAPTDAPPSDPPVVIRCPAVDGGMAGPGTTFAPLPAQALPRCSAETKNCWVQAATGQAMTACLQADGTAPFVAGASSLNCAACDQIQTQYCQVASCKAEYSAYVCCKQTGGACDAEKQAVINCLQGLGGWDAQQCQARLVPRCF